MEATDPATVRSLALAEKAYLEVWNLVDLQFSSLGQRAIDALAPRRSDVIVDVGCGAGQTVLQLADRVGPEGKVIGVDIAPLLLECARNRATGVAQASFIACDATRLDFPDRSADGVFSRFGVMRFADPIAAFSNFHRLMKPSGRLAFVCWRPLEENELDVMPLRATGLEDRADDAPYSFANPAFIRTVLNSAGFGQIRIEPYDQAVSSGGLQAMLTVLMKVGILGKIIRENPEMCAPVEDRLRAALAAKIVQGRVSLNAAIWVVTATA